MEHIHPIFFTLVPYFSLIIITLINGGKGKTVLFFISMIVLTFCHLVANTISFVDGTKMISLLYKGSPIFFSLFVGFFSGWIFSLCMPKKKGDELKGLSFTLAIIFFAIWIFSLLLPI